MSRCVFIHQPGCDNPELVEVEESITVEELVVRHGEPGHRAWAEDGGELTVMTVVVEVIQERGHIYVGPHGEIRVTVRYGADDKARVFTPGSRVQTVLSWAEGADGFDLPPNERGDYGLFLPGATEPLDVSRHIGHLAECDDLRMTLAPIRRPQG